jgi:hypothetical protein
MELFICIEEFKSEQKIYKVGEIVPPAVAFFYKEYVKTSEDAELLFDDSSDVIIDD